MTEKGAHKPAGCGFLAVMFGFKGINKAVDMVLGNTCFKNIVGISACNYNSIFSSFLCGSGKRCKGKNGCYGKNERDDFFHVI